MSKQLLSLALSAALLGAASPLWTANAKSGKDAKPPTAAQIAKAKKAYLEKMKKGMDVSDSKVLGGKRKVSGALILPKGVAKDRMVYLDISRNDSGYMGNRFQMVGYTDGKGLFKFKIINLGDGNYDLTAKVDSDGDNRFTDADLVGCYNGGKAEPLFSLAGLPSHLKVTGKDLTDIKIVLGVKPAAAPTAVVQATVVPTVAPTTAPTEAPTAEPAAAPTQAPQPEAQAPALDPQAAASPAP